MKMAECGLIQRSFSFTTFDILLLNCLISFVTHFRFCALSLCSRLLYSYVCERYYFNIIKQISLLFKSVQIAKHYEIARYFITDQFQKLSSV